MCMNCLLYRNINIAEDEDGKHPKGMCNKCYTKLMGCKRLKYESMNNGNCQHAARQMESSSALWTHFDSSVLLHQCSSCSHYENQTKGGRPRKSLVQAAKRKVPAVSSFSTDVESNTSTDLHPILTSISVKKKIIIKKACRNSKLPDQSTEDTKPTKVRICGHANFSYLFPLHLKRDWH